MNGPEGQKERFDSPWLHLAIPEEFDPRVICRCLRAWPGREMAELKVTGPRSADRIRIVFDVLI
jgi:hypothetical protein